MIDTNYTTIDTFIPIASIIQSGSKLLNLSDDILIPLLQYLELTELIEYVLYVHDYAK